MLQEIKKELILTCMYIVYTYVHIILLMFAEMCIYVFFFEWIEYYSFYNRNLKYIPHTIRISIHSQASEIQWDVFINVLTLHSSIIGMLYTYSYEHTYIRIDYMECKNMFEDFLSFNLTFSPLWNIILHQNNSRLIRRRIILLHTNIRTMPLHKHAHTLTLVLFYHILLWHRIIPYSLVMWINGKPQNCTTFSIPSLLDLLTYHKAILFDASSIYLSFFSPSV